MFQPFNFIFKTDSLCHLKLYQNLSLCEGQTTQWSVFETKHSACTLPVENLWETLQNITSSLRWSMCTEKATKVCQPSRDGGPMSSPGKNTSRIARTQSGAANSGVPCHCCCLLQLSHHNLTVKQTSLFASAGFKC